MWDLDDKSEYEKVVEFELGWATTFADMREGHRGKEKREKIRKHVAQQGLKKPDGAEKWAFRILVSKPGRRPFDIENVGKLIIDAFCTRQIRKDKSEHENLGLYPDDTLDYVVVLEVAGKRSVDNKETTKVEIFAVRRATTEV